MSSPLELLPNTYRTFFSRFPNLTCVQKELIRPILQGRDVVLQASTGTGKTEAVLAPATEKLITHRGDYTIVYIVPTRALALDMNRRIKPLYKQLGLKAGIRTGDGKNLWGAKPDLLIMTPESLDVLLGSANPDNKHFLKHVHLMILDEVHVFLHHDRGHQLCILRQRLKMQSLAPLQTVALSATIADTMAIAELLELNKNVYTEKHSVNRLLHPHWVYLKNLEEELSAFFDDLYQHFGCKKILVFANTRKKCEQMYDLLNQEGFFSKKILLHYSNLSTKERKFIESSFRERKMGVCVATPTLELGIDIGDVDGVVLMEPPPTTMAFLQRIGRANRRQQHINFWGICQGANACHQLIKFLALFELAKENQVEKVDTFESYSVLFQQILSCLHAKKILSKNTLIKLFPKKSEQVQSIFHHMLVSNWLRLAKQPGLYEGGARYYIALKKRQIWSNFPPTDEEYAVILDSECIATLPLSIIGQLKPGDLIQLTGKTLKILQIEEKETRELWVEESDKAATKELFWMGFGAPTSFEVAQKMEEILFNPKQHQGILNRTHRLLEETREKMARSIEQPSGMRVHQLANGVYRYETFLGTVGNFILYHLVKTQTAAKIQGLLVDFDEIGIESSDKIWFNTLKIPHTDQQFQQWVSLNLPLLRVSFSWNSWLYFLPEQYQVREIYSRLKDLRVFQTFRRYQLETRWLPLPESEKVCEKQVKTHLIELKGNPWSWEKEKCAFGTLSFPEIPSVEPTKEVSLTATQLQGYVTRQLCSRWARFQRLKYKIEPHPRFESSVREMQSRQQQGITFKRHVIEQLQKEKRVFPGKQGFLSQAIQDVIHQKDPLFLAEAKLEIEGNLKGVPDLIYVKHQKDHICLEVWDIKYSQSVSYAQKWRVAFYAHLLKELLRGKSFSLPVKLSALGGLIYPSPQVFLRELAQPEKLHEVDKCYEKTAFELAPYNTWILRLIDQWNKDSLQDLQEYTMGKSCTSCNYFSYCYQESLSKEPPPLESQAIVSKNIESNDFPKNTKQWFFIHYDYVSLQWQIWENGEIQSETCIRLQEFAKRETFLEQVALQLQKKWQQSVNKKKYPHFLVYELGDWHRFQNAFQLTKLKTVWAMHSVSSAIQKVLQTHFFWPVHGRLTTTQVAACLGLISDPPPILSLYHREGGQDPYFELHRQIWNWCLSQVRSQRVASFECGNMRFPTLIDKYQQIHRREVECRKAEILEFQKIPLTERVKQFRSIGPMHFLGCNPQKRKCYEFSSDHEMCTSKFRVGDFLKLSPLGSEQIQDGFSVILDSYEPGKEKLSVRPIPRKLLLSKNAHYTLEENATDWNAPKVEKVLTLLKDKKFRPDLINILLGGQKGFTKTVEDWAEEWYALRGQIAGLNAMQKKAFLLPFKEKIGLIQGPPGTGKTQLLVWTLIALIAKSASSHRCIKILVTANTHHAIDQILKKVAKTFPQANVTPPPVWKYGRYDDKELIKLGVCQMKDSSTLFKNSSLILGATGFGVYQLLENKHFPRLFDWIIFDESSQMLVSNALLSLIFGKGNALFYGDTKQLSPVLMGDYASTCLAPRSILQELISRYGSKTCLSLNETYRMNAAICQFVSEQWYDGKLRSNVAEQKLSLSNFPLYHDELDEHLDPAKSISVVQLDHMGCQQSSEEEALWIAKAVKRLMKDYAISFDEIGILSPHRLQNNTIISALKKTLPYSCQLPRVDTVERMQGAEFDIVIFSATVSDKEIIHSPFLKEYRRFNVAITRSRKKFLLVASKLFFQSFPSNERELIAQAPFEIITR